MLTFKKRQEIVDRLGTLGDLVIDLNHRLNFPIESPSELAFQFPEKQTIVFGENQFYAAQMALSVPEKIFPLKSFDDLVKKLEKVGLEKIYPSSLSEFVSQQSMVGYSLKKDDKFLINGIRRQDLALGGPGDLPSLDLKDKSKPKKSSSVSDQNIEKLGSLGNMIIDILDSIYFPIENAMDLASQFDQEDHFIFGMNKIPISQVSLLLPSELFPLKSKEETLDKLLNSEFMELDPSNFKFLLNQTAPIGLMFEIDEKRLKKQSENYKMEFGDPGTEPESDIINIDENIKASKRTRFAEQLGFFGEMIYDIIDQRVNFPVKDPIDLSSRFKENDYLINGLERIPMAKFSLFAPESLFPIESLEDLKEKIQKSEFNKYSEKDFVQFLKEMNSLIGYSNPYSEKELIQMSKKAEMTMGGPDGSHNPFDKI